MTPENRIARLERRCRWMSFGNVVSVCVVGLCIFMGAAQAEKAQEADTVVTQRLEIVDADGQVRMRLGKADAGYGVIIYDADGKFRATLTDAPGGAGIQLNKDGGRIRLFAYQDGLGMSLHDANGKPRMVQAVTKDGPSIRLLDERGEPQAVIPEG